MAGLFDRAKSLLVGKRLDKPAVDFSLRCLCGEYIVGQRRDEHQSLICPSCGQAVFVLARSPLPELALPIAAAHAPAVARPVGKRIDKGVAVHPPVAASVNGDATIAMQVEDVDDYVKRPKHRAQRPMEAGHAPAEIVSRRSMGESLASAARALVPPRRWFSTPRLVLAGSALLVFATVVWQVNARKLNALREELVPAGRRGLQAMFEGKIEEAHERLGFAVQALDRLKEDFPDAGKFRQAFREVDIVANLNPLPFEELGREQRDAESFDRQIHGRTILIDAEVEKVDGGWRIATIGFVGDRPVVVDRAGLRLFETLGINARTRLIFGARISDAHLDEDDRFALRLDRESGVLLTDARLFADLGLSRDPAAAQIRERQLGLLEPKSGTP